MLDENGWTEPVQSQEGPKGSSKQEVMRPGLMAAELQPSLRNAQPLSSALGQAYLGPLTVSQAEPLVRPENIGGPPLKHLSYASHHSNRLTLSQVWLAAPSLLWVLCMGSHLSLGRGGDTFMST